MRKKDRYSRFRMYIATTLMAFMIPALFSVSIVLSNKQKYLDNVIEYINKVSPIDISISDISISYKLELVLDNVKLYSKNSKEAFFDMDKASLRFNFLRIFIKRDPLYLLSDINIDNADFYPIVFDTSIFKSESTNKKNIYESMRDTVNSITPIFMDKNIHIKNFSAKVVDNNSTTEVSLNSLYGNFRDYGYFLSYDLNLPDKTIVHLASESTTNLSDIKTLIYAKDENGDLFKYNLFITNTYDKVESSLQNENKYDFINFNYNHNNEDINFSVTNIKIEKDTVYKFMDIALDTPIIYKFVKLDNKKITSISNYINTFRDADINAYGYYSLKNITNSYIDFKRSYIKCYIFKC